MARKIENKVVRVADGVQGTGAASTHPGMVATLAWDRLGNLGGDLSTKLDLDAIAKRTMVVDGGGVLL